MNPCEWFKPPEVRVRTDTQVNGSCNCCCDITCCLPFLRRRRNECQRDDEIQGMYDDMMDRKQRARQKRDDQIQGLYDDMIRRNEQERLSHEDTSLAAQGRSVTIGGIERKREKSPTEVGTEDKRASHRKRSKRKKEEKKEVVLRPKQRSSRDARHRLPKDPK